MSDTEISAKTLASITMFHRIFSSSGGNPVLGRMGMMTVGVIAIMMGSTVVVAIAGEIIVEVAVYIHSAGLLAEK
jgi:hypothetical protein